MEIIEEEKHLYIAIYMYIIYITEEEESGVLNY